MQGTPINQTTQGKKPTLMGEGAAKQLAARNQQFETEGWTYTAKEYQTNFEQGKEWWAIEVSDDDGFVLGWL